MTRRWTPVWRCFLQLVILIILLPSPCDSFSVPPAFRCRATLSSTSALYNNILHFRDDDDNDNNNDNERVRVPRGGRGRGNRQYEEDRFIEEYYETKERPYYEEEEEDEDYDEEEDYDDDDDEDYYDDDNDIDDFDFKEMKNDYDGDILIPNPILDQVDPEGAGERFGEIVRDPIFWRDLILVVAIFNFCEYVAQVPYY